MESSSGNGGTPKSSPLRQKQQRLATEIERDLSTGESSFHLTSSASFNHGHGLHSDWHLMSPSSVGSDFEVSRGGGLVTRYAQPPRHLCLSPSSSLSSGNTLSEGLQLFLPSPSSSHHHSTSMTTLLQQQQHLETMSFTSAFNSSLRHRRGKTLILPKLKIPSGRSGSGGAGTSAESGDVDSSPFGFQSSQQQHHHHRSSTSSHFRRSVSTSTFAESTSSTATAAATAAASTLSSAWYASASSQQQSSVFSSSSSSTLWVIVTVEIA